MSVYEFLRSLGYFRFYVILAFIFLILASAIGIFLPIWEARDLFAKVLTGNTFKELIEKSFHGSRCAIPPILSCRNICPRVSVFSACNVKLSL